MCKFHFLIKQNINTTLRKCTINQKSETQVLNQTCKVKYNSIYDRQFYEW